MPSRKREQELLDRDAVAAHEHRAGGLERPGELPETGRRVRMRLDATFDTAMMRGLCAGNSANGNNEKNQVDQIQHLGHWTCSFDIHTLDG